MEEEGINKENSAQHKGSTINKKKEKLAISHQTIVQSTPT